MATVTLLQPTDMNDLPTQLILVQTQLAARVTPMGK